MGFGESSEEVTLMVRRMGPLQDQTECTQAEHTQVEHTHVEHT